MVMEMKRGAKEKHEKINVTITPVAAVVCLEQQEGCFFLETEIM